MSKRNTRKKAYNRAAQQARRLTGGKFLRLMGKSAGLAVIIATLVTLASAYGLPFTDRWWVQFGIMFAIYLLFHRYLMREFRPKTYLDKRFVDET